MDMKIEEWRMIGILKLSAEGDCSECISMNDSRARAKGWRRNEVGGGGKERKRWD